MSTALPPAWAALSAEVNGRPLDGTPGVRSTSAPCVDFDGKTPDGLGQCDSDGHYLCHECSHLSAESFNWPEKRPTRAQLRHLASELADMPDWDRPAQPDHLADLMAEVSR